MQWTLALWLFLIALQQLDHIEAVPHPLRNFFRRSFPPKTWRLSRATTATEQGDSSSAEKDSFALSKQSIEQIYVDGIKQVLTLACNYVAIKLLSGAVTSLLREWDARSAKETIVESSKLTKYFKANDTRLTEKEQELLSSLVLPEEIEDHWAGLGGVHSTKRELWDIAVRLVRDNQRSSLAEPPAIAALRRPARSVLLYGPPGCGKTALVRGLAQRLRWPVLSIAPSSVLRSFVGESSQLIRSVFSLASKLRSCVVVLDEMDALFSTRGAREGTSDRLDRQLMTEFMTLWDDLKRRNETTLLVGLTNRPQDLDPAVQRRFERSFLLGLPDAEKREQIFRTLLHHVHKEENFDFRRCAQLTKQFSSSDIAELCKIALEQYDRKRARLQRDALRRKEVIEHGKVAAMHNVTQIEGSEPEPAIHDKGISTLDISIARQSYTPLTWRAQEFDQSTPARFSSNEEAQSTFTFWSTNNNAKSGSSSDFEGDDDGDEDEDGEDDS